MYVGADPIKHNFKNNAEAQDYFKNLAHMHDKPAKQKGLSNKMHALPTASAASPHDVTQPAVHSAILIPTHPYSMVH